MKTNHRHGKWEHVNNDKIYIVKTEPICEFINSQILTWKRHIDEI
jgi:hypothetical protein